MKANKILVGAVIVLVVVLGLVFRGYFISLGKFKEEQKTFKDNIAVINADMKILKDERDDLRKKAEENLKLADKYKDKADKQEKINVDLENKNKEWEKKVAKMEVDEVINITREILKVEEKEIWKNSFGIQFSLFAGRENLIKLSDWKFLMFTLIPGKEVVIETQKLEIKGLRVSVESLKGVDEKNKELEKKFVDKEKEYKDVYKAFQRERFWKRLLGWVETPLVVVLGALLVLK
jgi:hypothetical protein